MGKPFSSLYFGSNTTLYLFIFNSYLYYTSKLYVMAFICFWNHHLVIGSFCLSGVDWSSWWNDTNLSLHKKSPHSELFWYAFFLHFPAFGMNTERCGVSPSIQSECGKNADHYNSEYGLFLRSVCHKDLKHSKRYRLSSW